MTTIGLIGAGHIGSQIGRLAVAHGYPGVISNSRGPDTLSALVTELGPNARAATALEAATAGDVVVVSVPLEHYHAVPVERGGNAPTRFDALAALEPWVEKGTAPETMIAAQVVQGETKRTRPLCVYPQVATWNGTGSSDAAANSSCVRP